MTTNHVARRRELVKGFRRLSDADPDVMSGFTKLHRGAMRRGALDEATKELMALAISITSGCEGCITFHVHDALRAGADREQVEETLGVAVFMGGGPAAVAAVEALEALDQFEMAGVDRN
jgi:AhpD family alkylhydroperoxidase